MGFMLEQIIDFVDSFLPSVDPDFRDGAKDAIRQFESNNKINYLMHGCLEELSQGDIISKIPFFYFEEDGKQKSVVADAMVISTSCHIDQKDKLIFVPILPLSEFEGNKNDLMKNVIFDFMYIPDTKMSDSFISFDIMNSYSKKLIYDGIVNGKINRIASLNQLGYYLFIIKLTVYLMRKEDSETLFSRNKGFNY